jgi:IS30 family transposase
VNTRVEFGHWEGDLVVGRKGTKSVLLTLLERKTRKYITTPLPSKEQVNVAHAFDLLEKRYGRLFYQLFKTITFDNGIEFLDHDALELSRWHKYRVEDKARFKVYYAHPYRSGERGSNENANGLLRRAGIIKGKNIGLMSKASINAATRWVNTLPRALLGFKCAQEVFDLELQKLKASTK